jgi:hypothetical protein
MSWSHDSGGWLIFFLMKYFILTLVIAGITFALTYILLPRPFVVHHHANFAVYIDGKQKDFTNDVYMEEVSRCNITEWVLPQDRIHLHEHKGDLVHVHMAAATWGDLFANLEWGMGSGYLVDDFGKIYTPTWAKHLYYYINSEVVQNPQNIVLESTDRLLVWYGTGTQEDIQQQSKILVANTADEYNHKADPASCSTNEYGILGWVAEFFHELFE